MKGLPAGRPEDVDLELDRQDDFTLFDQTGACGAGGVVGHGRHHPGVNDIVLLQMPGLDLQYGLARTASEVLELDPQVANKGGLVEEMFYCAVAALFLW